MSISHTCVDASRRFGLGHGAGLASNPLLAPALLDGVEDDAGGDGSGAGSCEGEKAGADDEKIADEHFGKMN